MLRVTIFSHSGDSRYETLGEIIWDGKEISIDPHEDPELSRIAVQPYWLSTSDDQVEEFNPNDEPEAWILNLHKRYPTPSIIAGQATPSKN